MVSQVFNRVHLGPGESKKLDFLAGVATKTTIGAGDGVQWTSAFVGEDGTRMVPSGRYAVVSVCPNLRKIPALKLI